MQTDGYEVDLVAARADMLVLATVKSFFGSRGVVSEHVTGDTKVDRFRKLYLLLNSPAVATRYSVKPPRVTATTPRRWSSACRSVGSLLPSKATTRSAFAIGPPGSTSAAVPSRSLVSDQVVGKVRTAAAHKQYRDNPVLVTLKVLQAAGQLVEQLPDITADATEQ